MRAQVVFRGNAPIPHGKLYRPLFWGYALRVSLATHMPPTKEDDMRALLQRVTAAEVKVDGQTIGATGAGLLILICAMVGDSQAEADQLINKITKLRIFKDDAGKMNKSIMDIGGSALVVSQFTLAADTKRGNRPGFSNAASPDEGRALYEYFADGLAQAGVPVETGKFGADMKVSLTNDGPVTIWLDTAEGK
jgi:D-tyrosyl-tRNA(Tyr) deacylase